MVRWVWKEKIKTPLLLHSPARCVHCRLPYICEAWAWVTASTVVKLFNKRDNHLFLHSTLSLHRSNRKKTWSSQAFCPTKHHLNSHPSLPNCFTTVSGKSLQLCPTLCDPIEVSQPGSPIPGILPARVLEWVAIFFSNAWKWKVIMKSLSRVRLLATPWTAAYQAPHPWDFPGKSTGVGCHCLLQQAASKGIQIPLF